MAFTAVTHAHNGERKINLAGNLNAAKTNLNTPTQAISIHALEQQLELHRLQVNNPWDKKTAWYQGVWLESLVDRFAKPNTTQVSLTAIDDYQVTISKAQWQKFRILVVTQENDQYLSVANKGPLRIVFPDYATGNKDYELNLHLWAWMINRIEFN